MQLTDTRILAASPDRVWAALVDPAVLQPCIPGCESMTGSPEAGYEAVMAQKAGPLSFRVTGIVTLSDVVPGQGASVAASGKGGVAGAAAGRARVLLAPEGPGTRLTYVVEADVHGKIAQLGLRIVEGFARRLADQFFERFSFMLENPGQPLPAPKTGWLGRVFGKAAEG